MKTNLIGISGDLGDTVGKILQALSTEKNMHGVAGQLGQDMLKDPSIINRVLDGTLWYGLNTYQIKRFDNKRKDIVCLLLGCTRKQLEKDLDKELGEEWWQYEFYDRNDNEWRRCTERWYDKYSNGKYSDRCKLIKLTPRKILQLLGTEAGRNIIHPNIWVNALFVDYKKTNVKLISNYYENNGIKGYIHDSKEFYPKWIITDVKRPDQAQAIKDRGGIVIRIDEYTLYKGFKHVKGLKSIEHPSETALDDYEFDHVVENNGSIEELVEKVKQLNIL